MDLLGIIILLGIDWIVEIPRILLSSRVQGFSRFFLGLRRLSEFFDILQVFGFYQDFLNIGYFQDSFGDSGVDQDLMRDD